MERLFARHGDCSTRCRLLLLLLLIAGAFTAALSDRTVSAFARRIHRASSSPIATGATVSALRTLTSPRRTASLKSGRSRSLRASRAIFTAVLALIPSSSRA